MARGLVPLPTILVAITMVFQSLHGLLEVADHDENTYDRADEAEGS